VLADQGERGLNATWINAINTIPRSRPARARGPPGAACRLCEDLVTSARHARGAGKADA